MEMSVRETAVAEQTNREKEIFEGALDCAPGEERQRYIEVACGEDAALLARIQALLRAHDAGEEFLPEEPKETTKVITEKPGDQIGRYRLLEKIGEGGCGVVYMAEQSEPLRRRVALKIIKLGMDTKSVIARFEAERQALALMDHPNIAKVLDDGATNTGRPFFVMELVGGIKITDYCEQNHLTTSQRLDLFIQVCRAIQHAHQKGVIHRDIKPSNVLVAIQDGVPVPKVIDFGIAKATHGKLTDQTVFTAFEQFLGTPAYMSPEQAQLGGLDVDTRSDIYSLGVLLYELLTGKTPFDTKELLAVGLDAMRRTICEKEPPTPSMRLTQERRANGSAASGKSEIENPKSEIDRDLDWIVMKCLEKDRARRYETANGLARDIERHLSNEPVVASPPSNLYRLRKLVHRNKVLFAATGAVALALILGLGLSTWLFFRERAGRREQARLRQQAQVERATAQAEAAKSEQVGRFLGEMLHSVGPSVAKGRDTIMLREILDRTTERIGQELTNQPQTQIEIRSVLINTYHELGLYARMEELARQNLRLARSLPEADNTHIADALAQVGDARQHQGYAEEAEPFTREALGMYRRHLGEEHHRVAYTLNDLATILKGQGKLAEAETSAREAVRINRKVYGEEHRETASTLNTLAEVLRDENKLEEAEKIWRDVLPMQRRLLGNEAPSCIISLINLGGVLERQGNAVEAERLEREALDLGQKVLSADHPHLAICLGWLAQALKDQAKLPEAEATAREALALRRKLGNELEEATALNTLGNILSAEGRVSEEEETYRAALTIQRKFRRGAHPDTATVLGNLAGALRVQAKLEEAEEMYREALAMVRSLPGSRLDHVASLLRGLAWALESQDKWADAEPLWRELVEIQRERVGGGHRDVAVALNSLAMDLQEQGKLPEAEKALRAALLIFRAAASRQPPQELINLAIVLHHLADVLREEKAFAEARSLAEESVGMYRRHPEMSRAEKQHALEVLAALLMDLGDNGASEAVFQELLKEARARLPADDPRLASAIAQLAFALLAAGKYAEAEPLARECLTIREAKAPGDWRTFSTQSMVGGCLLGQQKYAEAEPLLLSGYQGLKEREATIPRWGKPCLKEALQRLVQLFENTHRPEQAAEWKKKLEDFGQAWSGNPPAATSPSKPSAEPK
jgi:serine/threonine protein kinase/tetratricopeptide (TPR) repeat protein